MGHEGVYGVRRYKGPPGRRTYGVRRQETVIGSTGVSMEMRGGIRPSRKGTNRFTM